MTSCRQEWYLVLPDSDAALAAIDPFDIAEMRVIRHPSGRPWLVGCWTDGALTLFERGSCSIALIGEVSISAMQLEELARELLGAVDSPKVASGIGGSFHFAASVAGQVRVQGSLSGFRRVFHACFGDVTIACTRSDVLAEVIGASVDERILAAHLTTAVPYPVGDRSVWRGVQAVPEDSYLRLDSRGAPQVRIRWTPPEPVVRLQDAAPDLTRSLTDAVALRAAGGGLISADLSGGLDSTALCFCAHRGPAKLLAITRAGDDEINDDEVWARKAARLLDGVEHRVVRSAELPGTFADLLRCGEGLDEPVLSRTRGDQRAIVRLCRAEGSRLHLSGEGGDQVLQGLPSYLHTTIRRYPLAGFAHVRANLARSRWRWTSMIRALADARPFDRWLADEAADLSPQMALSRTARLGWQAPVHLPPWASGEAVDTVAALLRDEAAHARPLAPDRGQHTVLWSTRIGARQARHLAQVSEADGLVTSFPYYDDEVLESALPVRLHERISPLEYKPLLVAAMRGTVPEDMLARNTKGEYSADVKAGLVARKAEFADLLDRPVLEQLGLVDGDVLHRAYHGTFPPRMSLRVLEATLLLECWLRAHSGKPVGTGLIPARS